MKEEILGANDLKRRDLTMIKICENCGRKYHPRRNSYQLISKYCSQSCVKEARRKRFRPPASKR